jgi:hypothetical protein
MVFDFTFFGIFKDSLNVVVWTQQQKYKFKFRLKIVKETQGVLKRKNE